jgi:hypothetical protein
MATIEELEARAAEIDAAEGQAIAELVDHLREGAVKLPEGSQLALTFARCARGIEPWAKPGYEGAGRSMGVFNMTREIQQDQQAKEPPDDGEAS